MMSRMWSAGLLMLLLAGCGAREMSNAPKVFKGMHLLADAQIMVKREAAGGFRLNYEVNVINGGDQTCKQITNYITFIWPPGMQQRVESGGMTGMLQPLRPNDRGLHSGGWVLDIPNFDPAAFEDLAIAVSCGDPKGDYVNIIKPRIYPAF